MSILDLLALFIVCLLVVWAFLKIGTDIIGPNLRDYRDRDSD